MCPTPTNSTSALRPLTRHPPYSYYLDIRPTPLPRHQPYPPTTSTSAVPPLHRHPPYPHSLDISPTPTTSTSVLRPLPRHPPYPHYLDIRPTPTTSTSALPPLSRHSPYPHCLDNWPSSSSCTYYKLLNLIRFLSTLSQYLSQQTTPLEEKDILRMFHQMVAAMKYVHQHNVLHR